MQLKPASKTVALPVLQLYTHSTETEARVTVDAQRKTLSELMREEGLDIALLLQADLLRYETRTRRSVESLEPTGDTPRLDAEHLTHEEELISRIWHHVYGLRAELIAYARLDGAEGHQAQAEDHRQAALWQEAALKEVIKEYSETYGKQVIKHGEAEYAVEALQRLVGWEV